MAGSWWLPQNPTAAWRPPSDGGQAAETGCGPAQAVHGELRAAREDLVTREQQFERELATAQTLSGMYKEASEARGAKAAQLEGVVRELRAHLEARPVLVLHDGAQP